MGNSFPRLGLLIIAVIAIALFVVFACSQSSSRNESPVEAGEKIEEALPSLDSLEKISDAPSKVFRFIDKDYGIVIYIVDTYRTGDAPSVSGVRVGDVKVRPVSGAVKIIKSPDVYRIVDLEMKTVSYVVDTYRRGSAPMIATFPLELK